MSSSDFVRVSIVEESTFGTTPATPSFLVLRHTTQNFVHQIPKQTDPTVTGNRGVDDLIPLGKSATGQIGCTLRYSPTTDALFQLLRGVLMSSGESAVVTTASLSALTGESTITRASGSFVSDGYEVGDVVKPSGFDTVADNTYWRVSAVSALELTCEGALWGSDESGTITLVRAARMKDGSTQRSFTVEVARTDRDIATIYRGVTWNQLALAVASNSIISLTFDGLGKSAEYVSAPISGTGNSAIYITGASYTSPAAHPSLTTPLPELQYDGTDEAFQSFDVSLSNNLRPRDDVTEDGPAAMLLGSITSELRYRAYVDDHSRFSDYAGNTAQSLWFILLDANNRGWSLSFSSAKLREVSAPSGGLNQTDYENGTLVALRDSGGVTLRLQRWA